MIERNVYFDNAKGILIFCVVFGHIIGENKEGYFLGSIFNAIYSFHMPCFIFLAGYFSRNITSHRIIDLYSLIYPFLVFQILNILFIKFNSIPVPAENILNPIFQNWFLLALFIWRLFLPYFKLINMQKSLFITIVVAFYVGSSPEFNVLFGLHRTFYWMPLFLLGAYSSNLDKQIELSRKYRYYLAAVFTIALLSIFIISYSNGTAKRLLYFAFTPYSGYGSNFPYLFLRMAGFISSFLISLVFLSLVPKGKTLFSVFGKHSLSIFLMHMFIIWLVIKYIPQNEYAYLLCALIISFIACVLLSGKYVNIILSPLLSYQNLKDSCNEINKKLDGLIEYKKKS